jgi:beta-glucosidase
LEYVSEDPWLAAELAIAMVQGSQLLQEAVDAARGADHVLVFLGLPGEDESEGFDRTHIDLPTNQVALVHALAEVHNRLIVVLANGGVVRVSTLGEQGRRDLGMLVVGAGSGRRSG